MEMVSTCLLSSTAPRLQIKNQLRAGGGFTRQRQGELGALACMMDGGDWQGPGPQAVRGRLPETAVWSAGKTMLVL